MFYVFTGNADLNDIELTGIKTNQWVLYNSYTKVWYGKEGNRSNDLVQQVEQLKPDILYIVGMFDWHFNLVPLFFCKAEKKILSVRGMLHEGALSQKKLKKQIFLRVFKFLRKHKNIIYHATDEIEMKHIEAEMGTDCLIHIAGNFPRIITQRKGNSKKAGNLHLISIALISPMKNHLLIIKALKKIKSNIKYSIYGPVKDADYWQQCVKEMDNLQENIMVTFYGDLQPQLVQEKLYEADVFIMPSKSENFGHSIIEALSAGLPVITSDHTPWNGLKEKKAGINVDTSEEAIFESIEFFVEMNKVDYEEWSNGASRYTNEVIDTGSLKLAYEKMFTVEKYAVSATSLI